MCEECKATNDRLDGVITALLMANYTTDADGHWHAPLTRGQRVALTELLVMPVGGGSRAEKPLYEDGNLVVPRG